MTARLRTAAAIALTVGAAAGCGGGPSAEERREELRRWTSAVDGVCRETRERIAGRGDALTVLDLDRIADRAGADVRAAVDRIRGVPLSEAARPREVRAFLSELDKVGPWLDTMKRTTADGSMMKIAKLGQQLADATKRVQVRAEAAGLRECADERQFDAVLDAFTAPVYAARLARFEVWLVGALRPLARAPALTSAAFAGHVRRVGKVLERAEERIDDLHTYEPNRVTEAARDLEFAFDMYETFLGDVADALRGGRRVLTPVGVRHFQRETRKLERDLKDAIAEMRSSIGAKAPGADPPLETEQSAA